MTVTVDGQTLTATAEDDGTWTVTPTSALAIGPQTITASWQVSNQTLNAAPVAITVAPPPLVITSPADGSRTFVRRPAIRGSGAEPGSAITVAVANQTLTTTADDTGNWTVQTEADLTVARQTATATQTVNETISDDTTSTFTVAQLLPPTITRPAAGSRTFDRRPVLAGTAEPGALVTATVSGRTLTARADRSGRWQTGTVLALGRQTLAATQTVESVTSAPSAPRTFTIVAPPPPESTNDGGNDPDSNDSGSDDSDSDDSDNSGGGPSDNGATSSDTTNDQTDTDRTAESDRSTDDPSGDTDEDPSADDDASDEEPTPAASAAPENPNNYLPVQLNFAAATITPGRVASFVGTLGPNAATTPVTVTLSGTVNRGMLYRSVDSLPAGTCVVTTLSFSCTITLQPGQQAVLQVRLLADALNAPAYARQQLTVSVPGGAQPNTVTSTTRINRPTEVSQLAKAISSGPGTFVVLLLLYLFALAATEYERQHPRT